jgi:hypothetical protein
MEYLLCFSWPGFIQFGLGEGRYPLSDKQGSGLFRGSSANLVDIP